MLDLGALQRLYRAWGEALPRVQAHYSVRCNPDPALLGTLAALGCGFDCASEAEIRAVSEQAGRQAQLSSHFCRQAQALCRPAGCSWECGNSSLCCIPIMSHTGRHYSHPPSLPTPPWLTAPHHPLQVAALGVHPDRILLASPCKRPKDLRCAADRGIELTAFDTEAELAKLARWAPGSRALLRIRAEDPGAPRCQLAGGGSDAGRSSKHGAEAHEWEPLLAAAASLGVTVAGVAISVGSSAPGAFAHAVEVARRAWDLGAAHGFPMRVLDLGGGSGVCAAPKAANAALAAHFPQDLLPEGEHLVLEREWIGCCAWGLRGQLCCSCACMRARQPAGQFTCAHRHPAALLLPLAAGQLRIIAEPGRFFAESIATMGCMVYGRRVRMEPCAGGSGGAHGAPPPIKRVHSCRRLAAAGAEAAAEAEVLGFDYWVIDGLYGSMASAGADRAASLAPRPLLSNGAPAPPEAFPSAVFGPSCEDGLDTLLSDHQLPELQVGSGNAAPGWGAGWAGLAAASAGRRAAPWLCAAHATATVILIPSPSLLVTTVPAGGRLAAVPLNGCLRSVRRRLTLQRHGCRHRRHLLCLLPPGLRPEQQLGRLLACPLRRPASL